MKSFYLLLLTLAVSAVSCRTKDGEPGPAGESTLNKQGSISGTITYADNDGNDKTTSFNYQYFESLEDNKFYYEDDGSLSYYNVEFQRRDLKDNNNYFNIEFSGNGTDGIENLPANNYVNFSMFTLINNELYEFSSSYNSFEITNFSLDHTTGRLLFDYSGNVYYSGENTATVTGRVDVILNKQRSNYNPK
jgi:hypothetical protein